MIVSMVIKTLKCLRCTKSKPLTESMTLTRSKTMDSSYLDESIDPRTRKFDVERCFEKKITVAYLIKSHEWPLLKSLMRESSMVPIDDPSRPHVITSDIVIHFAAPFKAPLSALLLLSKRYPESSHPRGMHVECHAGRHWVPNNDKSISGQHPRLSPEDTPALHRGILPSARNES